MKVFRSVIWVVTGIAVLAGLIGCSPDIELGNGTYVMVSDTSFRGPAGGSETDDDETADEGWTPVLMVRVEEGTVDRAVFDLLGSSGDYLSRQEYPLEEVSREWNAGLGELFERFGATFAENPLAEAEVSDGRHSVPEWVADSYNGLAAAAAERGEAGDTGLHEVDLELEGERGNINLNSDWLSFEYYDARTTGARGGVVSPGDRSGGMAVTASHEAATEAGMEVLRAGGTAADAAVATAATMSVVEPYFSSPLGGGTWLLYYDAESGEVSSVDGVGPAPMAAENELFQDDDFFGRNGIHRAIVPGSWGGYMELLKRYGTQGLDELLESAIGYAEDGAEVGPAYTRWLNVFEPFMDQWPDAAEIYRPDGEMVSEGDTIYNPDLADTYRSLAQAWSDARPAGERAALNAAADYYYRGPIAEALVEFSENNGGLFAPEDFNDFENYGFVDPISIEYALPDSGGVVDVYQNPPNSQGIAQLQALQILEGFDFSGMGPQDPEAIHRMAEALKLAFVDRNRYVGDPEFVDVPVEELLSEEYAESQRERISSDSVIEWPVEDELGMAGHNADTTTFQVVDRYGNAAAVTTSIGASFLVAGDTGIHMNERLGFMHSDPEDVNSIQPGKKVRHTSGPQMVLRDGDVWFFGGNTGADFQPQGQLQQFMSIAEFGLGAQDAIAAPRFEPQAFASTIRPFAIRNRLRLEPERFSDDVVEQLRETGHEIERGGTIGAANIILIEDHERGDIEAAAETRQQESAGRVEMPE